MVSAVLFDLSLYLPVVVHRSFRVDGDYMFCVLPLYMCVSVTGGRREDLSAGVRLGHLCSAM